MEYIVYMRMKYEQGSHLNFIHRMYSYPLNSSPVLRAPLSSQKQPLIKKVRVGRQREWLAFPDKEGGLSDVLSVSGIKEKGLQRVKVRA